MLNNINAYWPKIRSTYLCIFKILKIKNFHWQRYNLPCTVGFVRVKPLHFFYIPIVKPPLFSGGFRVSHSRNTTPCPTIGKVTGRNLPFCLVRVLKNLIFAP